MVKDTLNSSLDRPLENGDIVNLDVTVFYKGFHVDLNESYFVGQVPESSKFLVEKAYTCLQKAIEICKPGAMYRDVGNVISKYINDNGLSVVRTYCGHGIGKLFHCAPK
jgi:methionyl aminopeptidase